MMKRANLYLRSALLALLLAAPVGHLIAAPHVRVAGVWQEVTEIHARVSGTWQPIQEGWVRVSGVWQQFYTAVTVNMTLDGGFRSGASSQNIRFESDGDITGINGFAVQNITETWTTDPVTGGDYSVYATILNETGNGCVTGTFGSWLTLDSTRTWSTTAAGTCEIQFEIRRGTGSVLDTDTFTIAAS